MLNKKELALINSRIEDYRKWAKEEESEARRASTTEDRDYHSFQARLNESAADSIELLLSDLLGDN